jgi:hypothetical protein
MSNATAMCDGFSFSNRSKRVMVKPKMAEVFSPLELTIGLAPKAKKAR